MMLGHLTLAGIAELVLTAGVVAFLQRTDGSLLAAAAGRRVAPSPPGASAAVTGSLRPLWVMLGVLLVLTPLGLLAAGTAWGEWGAADFNDPAARQEMTTASLGQAPPAAAPTRSRAPLVGVDGAAARLRAAVPPQRGRRLPALRRCSGPGSSILAVTAIGALARLRGRGGPADGTVGV